MNISSSSFNIFKRDIIYFINFLTSILISRRLGVIALGIWSILRLISAYGEVIEEQGLNSRNIFYRKEKYDEKIIFSSINIILIVSILIISILLFNYSENIYNLFFKEFNGNYKIGLY